MADANRCGATRADAPDKPCIRPVGHPPLHADADGETWGDASDVTLIREAREKLLGRLGFRAHATSDSIVDDEPRDTSEAETVILAILIDRLGGKVTITEREAHEMRAKLARSVLWRLDAYRNPAAMEWTMELHKPMSET